jgi:hypothetical protein
MKAYAIFFVLVSVTSIAFYVVWMNRASEKIITAVLPISVAALIGIFMAVFVFGGQAATTVQFPAMLIFKAPENIPVALPFRPVQTSLFLVPLLAKTHPEVMRDTVNDGGVTLYHHLLQKSIIEALSLRYSSSWRAKIIRYDTSTGNSTQYGQADAVGGPSRKITKDEMATLLTGNRFAKLHNGITEDLVLPPGTNIQIQPPHNDPKLGQVSSITLDNDFMRVTIETRSSSWGFLFGGYRLILGQVSDTNTDLREATFEITIKHEFKRLRTGHPEMPQYKAWAGQLTEEIQREFDEQKIWAKTKEDYAFAKQLGLPMPTNFTQPYGPLQAPEQH